VAGMQAILGRRGGKRGPVLLTGPGKVGQALDLDTSWSNHPLTRPGGLTVLEGCPPSRIAVGPRVGIDYASPEHRALPWRFADADSVWVTRPRALHVLSSAPHVCAASDS
jgi:DNA-3-methyladenine glycosylase